MAKIDNDTAYILDLQIDPNDTVIGSDANAAGRTKQYSFGQIAAFLQTSPDVAPGLQTVVDIENTTTRDIEFLSDAKLLITDQVSYSPILGAKMEMTLTDTSTSSLYGSLKYIKKSNGTGSETSVASYNYIENNGDVDYGFLRGGWNHTRDTKTGVPHQMVSGENLIQFRNSNTSGTGVVSLLSGLENTVSLQNYGFNGTLQNVLGCRSQVQADVPDATIEDVFVMLSELDISNGTTINHWVGIQIDVTQTQGEGQILGGSFLEIAQGIDEDMARTNGIKAINSLVDIPSFFLGDIELGDGVYSAALRNGENQTSDIIVETPKVSGVLALNPILEEDTNVTGTKDIDWDKDTFNLTLTGNTTLTQSNLPETNITKTITIYTTGNFDLTLPASWDRVQGSYDSDSDNQIVVEYISPGNYWVSISNI